MTKRSRTILAAALIPVAFCTGLWLRYTRPWESPIERAHRLCRECGLDDDEIDRLIDTKRHAGLMREQELDLFYTTFEDRADAELCKTCAEAVLDEAVAWSSAY